MDSLLIKNGTIVNSKECFKGDILVEDGKIAAILEPGTAEKADRIIDADGKYVIPGCIDTHVHMMDPGFTERETFTSGTRAAAYGGITMVTDHHRTSPEVYSVKELKQKIEYLSDKAVVDFGLKGGARHGNTEDMKDMWDAGVTGFKAFTCDLHGVKKMSTADLLSAFRKAAELGATVLIHSEDNDTMASEEERLKAENRTDYLSQSEWRNRLAERIAVLTVVEIAKAAHARVVIAHVSQAFLLKKIKEARDEGYEIYAECQPHYLYLTEEDLEKKGPWVKFTPPMRDKENQKEMWKMLNQGGISVIGSDHCPYPKEDKIPGEKNIWDAPNGIPGVETTLRLMLNAVNEGKTTINKVVELMAENQAKIYHLVPRKGFLLPGFDADIDIIDMEKEEVLSNDKVISKCGWTPYDGLKIKGVPETVILRGKVIVDKEQIIGEPGYGAFVNRSEIR